MNLLNKSALRRHILARVKLKRPGWTCTRVSAEALEAIEADLHHRIDEMIHRHPSGCGKTFKPA